jgi:cytoskeleton protein RodZ
MTHSSMTNAPEMEHRGEAPSAEAQPLAHPSPGSLLGKARAEKGLSLEDVAQRVKYSPRQILALEQDDYAKLSGTTFVRGMIRSYSKLLGIDSAPLLAELERREVPAQATVDLRTKRVPFPQDVPRSNRTYLALSALFVLVASAVVLEWQTGIALWKLPFAGDDAVPAVVTAQTAEKEPLKPDVMPEQPLPVATAGAEPVLATSVPAVAGPALNPDSAGRSDAVPATSARTVSNLPGAVGIPAPAAPKAQPTSSTATILLQFQRDSWVQIRQADGRILLSQMNRGGSEQQLDGRPPFDVVIGNAPAVRMVYNGQPFDLRPHYKVDVARLVLE